MDVNELRFVVGVSSATRIDPRVVIAWVQQEGANSPGGTGGFNYLNLRPFKGDPYSSVSSGGFEQFKSVNDAIKATVIRLNQPFAKPIIATAATKPTPSAQINAIASTGWDSSHYGGSGGRNLLATFSKLFKNPNDSYLDPSNARAVANTVNTPSGSDWTSTTGGIENVPGQAAHYGNQAIRHIPGVAQVEDVGSAIKWVSGNWDRIAWVIGGSILVILGLLFVLRKPATTAAAAYVKKGK